MRTELAICLAIVLCQNPSARLHIRRELAVLPTWMHSVRKALLHALSFAQPASFRHYRIVDCTGVAMNVLPKLAVEDSRVKVFTCFLFLSPPPLPPCKHPDWLIPLTGAPGVCSTRKACWCRVRYLERG